MKDKNENNSSPRRGFLRNIGAGAAALGLASITSSFTIAKGKQKASTAILLGKDPADAWFDKVKGTHRVVFDATRPNEIMPFVWPRIFLMTNAATGSPESDCGVVVVLRHEAIGYAFNDKTWEKYNMGDVFKAHEVGMAFQAADKATATKTRNPFYMTKPGDFMAPGVGAVAIGIPELQASGVMFCVCSAAMTVYANALAGSMGLKGEDVFNEWKANIIPGIQMVPSGVWALGRAQEHECNYIFAG
jgi:intracellular sulfur oxidation DsrE/DsrF family protein